MGNIRAGHGGVHLSVVSVFLLLVLSACGGGGTSPGGNGSTGSTGSSGSGGGAESVQVSISPTNVTVQPNAYYQFKAGVTGTANTAIAWQVEEANGGTVDQTGYYQAPLAQGVYHVMAVSQADTNVYAAATVSVPTSAGNGTITVH